MLVQHGSSVGTTLLPMGGGLFAVVLHLLDDGGVGGEHSKGYFSLEKGRLILVKSKKRFRGVQRLTYKDLS